MQTTIKCPKCGEQIEISQALSEQVKEEILEKINSDHQKEIENIKLKTKSEVEEKVKKDQEIVVKNLENEAKEEKERNSKLIKNLEELSTEIRSLRRKDGERELEFKKQIFEKEEEIRKEAEKEANEKNAILSKEKDKKLNDALEQIEEMKRKMQQGSQQLQGEILEIEIEDLLRNHFQADLIEEIKKGQKGADIKYTVLSPNKNKCGTILIETKNYQTNWNNQWIPKLKQDQRDASADVAVLISNTFPINIESDIDLVNGVWICKPKLVIPLITSLRDKIYSVARQKAVNEHRTEKAGQIYDYITSTEFKHNIESLIEVYQEMYDQIAKEKRAFESQWKSREKQIEKLFSSTASVCGSMQGIAGQSSLPSFKGLDMFQIQEDNKK